MPTICLISSMATRALLAELVATWQEGSKESVIVESVGGVDAARRVAAGEPFDVVVLASDAIDRLVDGGHAIAESRVDLVRSGVAIAVRHGTPHPPIDDEEALRTLVLSADRVAFSTGPSGTALQRLFAGWGIVDALKDRLVQAPPAVPVGSLVANGSADLGFQQLSEMMNVDGIEVLGMPPGLEIVTIFSAVLCSASTDPGVGGPLLEFLRSSATDDAKRRHGMTPA